MKLLTHNRIGDLCICYGFIKEFSQQYDNILLSVNRDICKLPNIVRLFSSIPNISFSEELVEENQYDKIISSNWWFNQVSYWYNCPTPKDPFPFDENMIFDRFWYLLANVPFHKKWDNFYLERHMKKELEVYYDILGLKDNEEYIFIHEDVNCKDEDRTIKRNYIDPNIKIISIADWDDIGIFDTTYLIEHAKEVHVINSSFLTFIDLMNMKSPNLNYHRYTRSNPAEQVALKLNWRIIE